MCELALRKKEEAAGGGGHIAPKSACRREKCQRRGGGAHDDTTPTRNECSIYEVYRVQCWLVDFVNPVEAVIPGAQGRLLAVLANTTADLNLRTLARLADVSVAQASRVMPRLEELGMVQRRDVPPSALFRLVPENVAVRAVVELARARETVVSEIGRRASSLPTPPVSTILFGSFVRGEAGVDSDLDLLVVRPSAVNEDDAAWSAGIEALRSSIGAFAGNRVDVLEIRHGEVAARLGGRSQLWRDVRNEGMVVQGLGLDALMRPIDG